jgi:hypothetical protein
MATVPGHDVILFCSAGEAGYGAVSGNFKFSEEGKGVGQGDTRYLWGSMYNYVHILGPAAQRGKESILGTEEWSSPLFIKFLI